MSGCRSFCSTLSGLIYICMWASIIYVIPSEIYQWYQDNKDLENLQIAVYVMIPLGYFIILIESEVCGEMQYLKNLGDVSNSASVVRQMRSKRPLITFHVQCYHYETRYRTVYTTKTDSQVKRFPLQCMPISIRSSRASFSLDHGSRGLKEN